MRAIPLIALVIIPCDLYQHSQSRMLTAAALQNRIFRVTAIPYSTYNVNIYKISAPLRKLYIFTI